MNKIIIYTDGSSKGNPGPGGYAAIIVDEKNVIEIGGHEPLTTNNRMEMTAAIEALKKTPEGAQIEIHTDSEYLMKGATIWIKNWQKNNWRTKDRKGDLEYLIGFLYVDCDLFVNAKYAPMPSIKIINPRPRRRNFWREGGGIRGEA
jgi:TusA-related sulfurtransferase